MQRVEKKNRRAPQRWERPLLIVLCAAVLAGILALTWRLSQPEPVSTTSAASTAETLYSSAAEDVVALTIQRSGEAAWSLVLEEDSGRFRLDDADGFLLSEATTLEMQKAAATIICEQVLSSDPDEYGAHLAEYGLEPPDCTAVITFRDGTVRTLHVGSRTAHTSGWYYMMLSGDDRLFALGSGMVEDLFVSRESLRDVTQPTLHKARIDRLTLRNGDGSVRAEWTLQCAIDETDAAERWLITAPCTYPADSTAMTNLLANAANLRLGAYVAPATAENLTLYGFDAPRQIIEIHMAEGSIGTTSWDGVYSVTDWPESTVTFTIGGARSDMVDYVLYGDAIYVSSHFTMGVFITMDPADTMNRYLVLTALGNLASLAIEEKGVTSTYTLTRTEQVAPNNELVYDEDGNIVWDVHVVCRVTTIAENGEALTVDGESPTYDAFAAAYTRLTGVAAAGRIPADDPVDVAPHTVYTFTDVDGTVHTVALTSYGVLHDAVAVDGQQVFYIAKGAFSLGLE
ncbi:MAG: DUF4340 domain-containing protein [Clostridia bacterium]|nr:DUF4340 domain-containing protein [Clostridia bacterium]